MNQLPTKYSFVLNLLYIALIYDDYKLYKLYFLYLAFICNDPIKCTSSSLVIKKKYSCIKHMRMKVNPSRIQLLFLYFNFGWGIIKESALTSLLLRPLLHSPLHYLISAVLWSPSIRIFLAGNKLLSFMELMFWKPFFH